jgi:hypothetical protein
MAGWDDDNFDIKERQRALDEMRRRKIVDDASGEWDSLELLRFIAFRRSFDACWRD